MRFALLPILLFIASSALADDIATEIVNARGLGPAIYGPGSGSEDITGSFLFDYTTGVAYDFSLSGTGAVSEAWDLSSPITAFYDTSSGFYAVFSYEGNGSLGDQIPFTMYLTHDPNGGFVQGFGSLTGFSDDSWGGSVIATPEPPAWLYALGALFVILAMKRKVLLGHAPA
jgi:hypothetical protein